MKKILLFLIIICAVASMNTAKAQCTISIANVGIQKTYGPVDTTISGQPNCTYKFNAQFDIIANGGLKYLFFHSWRGTDYVPSFDCSKQNQPTVDAPSAATLGTAINSTGKSFLDFGFINLNLLTITTTPINVTANIATTYPVDGTVTLNYAGATAMVNRKGTSDTLHFVVNNITIVLAGACSPNLGIIHTDIWASNSASGVPKAQCYICDRQQNFDNPAISIQKSCSNGVNTWEVGLTNSPANPPVSVVYKVYVDADHDGVQDLAPQDVLAYTSGSIVLQPGVLQTFNGSLPWPYCCINPWGSYGIYVTVTVTGFSNDLVSNVVEQGCATLPIKLRSFDANRNRSNVDLKWVTEIEINNKGFYVERKLSNGDWEEVGFVASKATNGNSNSTITYDLSDFNNTKGISQYRLRQVDFDGKEAYSQVRSVRGEGQKNNTIIYPNPSGDGKVNIIFEGSNNNGTRDVSLMDVSGKTLKQWKGVTNNNIQIDNLKSGFYTVRIVDLQTGEQTVEKFIVNKR